MRPALVVIVVVLLLGALIWVVRPTEREPAEMVPASLLGLVIINDFPESLDFLPQTRLGEWLDLDPREIQSRLEVGWFLSVQESVDRAIFVLHTLELKESGALRPHFTAFLCPKSGQITTLESWVQEEVVRRFGETSSRIVDEGSAQVIRGSGKGEVLFLTQEEGWVIVSNSESGWKDVQLTLADQAPNLGARSSFREIRSHIDRDGDLFLYYSGKGGADLFPEFGYSVSIDGEVVTDNYWEASP